MPNPQTQPVDVEAAQSLPKHTTPTWESELLLSGATVFGLLQLPPIVYAWVDRLHHQLPSTWDTVLKMSTVFVLSVVYGLIVTFLLHLTTRAYWVALVGLRSVYPSGIRWDRSYAGPIETRVQRAMFSDHDALIERADNLSTLVFSTGIAAVFNSTIAIMFCIPMLLLATVLQTWVWPLPDPDTWFIVTMALFVGPMALPRMLDQMIGNRLDPQSRGATLIASMTRTTATFGPWRLSAPLTLNLTSNVRHRYGFMMFLLLIYALITCVSAIEVLRRGHVDPSLLVQTGGQATERQFGDYYENTGVPLQVLPHIQGDIITDPYVRLWVPLDPHRMMAFRRACATQRVTHAAAPAMDDPQHALAACLGNLFAPRLDGRILPGLSWHPYRDDALGVDGLRTYIAAQALTAGEHQLIVAAPAADQPDANAARSWAISFWR